MGTPDISWFFKVARSKIWASNLGMFFSSPASFPAILHKDCVYGTRLTFPEVLLGLSLHKGAVKCVSLPAGSADSRASGHIQLIVPINFSQRTPGLLQEPALPWNRKLYLHCLGAWCSSIKGKRVL